MEFQIFFTFRTIFKRSNSIVFCCEKIMEFAMDIDKLNLANLVGKVMDKIMEYQIFCQSVQKDKSYPA